MQKKSFFAAIIMPHQPPHLTVFLLIFPTNFHGTHAFACKNTYSHKSIQNGMLIKNCLDRELRVFQGPTAFCPLLII